MDILSVPFHQLLNIKRDDSGEFIFKIEERPELHNHLETIHACVQLTLAEATSGEYLLNQFFELKDDIIPVIRKTEVKYQKPAKGALFSKAAFVSTSKEEVLLEMRKRNKALIKIKVDVSDSENKRTLSAVFEWFMIKK